MVCACKAFPFVTTPVRNSGAQVSALRLACSVQMLGFRRPKSQSTNEKRIVLFGQLGMRAMLLLPMWSASRRPRIVAETASLQ